MSDVQQGPGWWLASDGKWYPPESRPQPLPPPPVATPPGGTGPRPQVGVTPSGPPAYGQPTYAQPAHGQAAYGHLGVGAVAPRSVSTGLTGTLQGFLWAVCGFALVASVMALVSLVAFNTYWDTPINSRAEADAFDDWIAIDDAFGALAGIAVLCGLVVFVLMLIWMNGAHKTTQQLWFGERKWTSGWTVGAWFIPFANAVLPKLVLNEIERIALEPRSNGAVPATWRSRSLLLIGNLWWIGLIVGTVLAQFGGLSTGDEPASGDFQITYVLDAVGLALVGVSAIFGALYVRRLGGRLSAAGLRLEP
ncbi:MAG: DUF4328 domain-containing protein [Ilumatobacteraceae bacterium]